MTIQEFKSHFHKNSEKIHLNSSGQCLIPDVYKDTAIQWIQKLYTEGAFCAMEGWGQTHVTREKLADFLGADANEVSFFTTTAAALSQAALALPLSPGDEILTWDQEYPSNFYPWRIAAEKKQARLIQVESDGLLTPAQKILDRVNSKTKVIAVSWVQYQAGSVTELKYLSDQLKGRDIWLVADVIQGVGVRPFNFKDSGFDIVCGGSHKFLCSGYGAAYMVTKKSRQPQLAPLEYGAMTFGTPDTVKSFSLEPKTDSTKYEPGTKSMVEIIALGSTLDLFSKVGVETIFKEATRQADKLRTGLKNLNFKIAATEGPILNFSPAKEEELELLSQSLLRNNVSFAKRGPGIRLSTHGYTQDEEIEKVLSVLSQR